MSIRRLTLGYLFLVGLPLGLLIAIVRSGPADVVRHTAVLSQATSAPPLVSGALLLVLQILVILASTRLAGAAFRRIGQPAVIGEMVAGVALGPSFAGWLFPAFSAVVFPAGNLAHLEAVSQLGLVLFMFVVGVSLDTTTLRDHCRAALLGSHVSIALPLLLGAALATRLYPDLAGGSVGFMPFALFMGAAMSITAFPVLARILGERRMLRSRVGTVALACAAVDDVTGWCVLAGITVLIRAPRSGLPIWITIAGSLAFAAIMILFVRPLLEPLSRRCQEDASADRVLGPALMIALLSALATEFLGIHLLFGSFLAGAVMPKTPRFTAYFRDRVETFCLAVLMPLFFASTGLRTNFGALQAGGSWPIFGLIVAVAVAGKLGGATAASRLAGFEWREAATIGALMNTRGLMELVILNVGLELGILTPALFTLMVMMAILTTFMTAPLLWLFRSPSRSTVAVPYGEAAQSIRRAPG